MRKVENPGPVGDAILKVADARDVLLIVCAGRRDERRLATEHATDLVGDRNDDRRIERCERRQEFHHVTQRVIETLARRLERIEHGDDFAAHFADRLLDQEPAVEHRATRVRDGWRRIAVAFGLPAMDAIDVERRATRLLRLDRLRRGPLVQSRQ